MEPTTTQRAVDTEVLVVGAGPTGLMLANWLARLGVDHVVVDGKDGPTRESRAIVVQSRSMEIYDQLGMAAQVRERAVAVTEVVPGFEDRPARRSVSLGTLGHELTPYPGMTILEQSANEELLLDRLRRASDAGTPADGTDVVRWGTRLAGLDQVAEGVTVRLAAVGSSDAGATGRLRARYVVGCDGAGSTVRHAAGIGFTGHTNPDVFYLVDAVGVTGLAPGSVNIRPGSDRFLLGFPMGEPARQRLIGTVPGDEPDLPRVADELRNVFGVEFTDADWFTTYRVHHRVADRFRAGRILLAGDAAHVHSPVGGQGMNTGMQDAHNLAFALAEVLTGTARESRLDHYEAERRPVARRLVATTDRLFDAVTDARPLAARGRRALVPALRTVLPVVVPLLPSASRLAGYVGQLRIHYWRSATQRRTAGGRRDAVVGRRLPWTGDNHRVLSACVWQVHAYGAPPPEVADLPAPIAEVHAFGACPDRGLPAGTLLLVRPDGFVVQRARVEDTDVADVFAAALAESGLVVR